MHRNRRLPHGSFMEPLQPRLLLAIDLDIVALHEFGHSLGLAHHPDTAANSVMEAYYNPNYNKANLANDPAVFVDTASSYASLLELFSDARISGNSTSWKDSLDNNPGDGTVNVTYSFMPDGNTLDSRKKNNLFATMNARFGSPSVWQPLLAAELQRWADVSTGNLSFREVSDNRANAGATGAVQNDSRFGDIRIGAHRFDGQGGTLAHAYYPPPNGGTIAGDAHFASEEAWVDGDPLTTATSTSRSGGPRSGPAGAGSFVLLSDGRYWCPIDEGHGHGHGHDGHDDHDDHDAADLAAAPSGASAGLPAFRGALPERYAMNSLFSQKSVSAFASFGGAGEDAGDEALV